MALNKCDLFAIAMEEIFHTHFLKKIQWREHSVQNVF